MFKIVDGDTMGLEDVDAFIDLVNDLPDQLTVFFDRTEDIFVARAPGRLDVMGGIADYSGSLVLPMPIAEATFAAVQKCEDPSIEIVSLGSDEGSLRFLMSEFDLGLGARGYDNVRNWFGGKDHWASYIAGALFALHHELGLEFSHGLRILIHSSIPIGKGVSSSAAVEVSTMQAVCAAVDIKIEPLELAMLCQLVENKIVGAACGIMDQIAVHCGVENSLVSLVCQPALMNDPLPIADGLELWGIDSGISHAVIGSDYSSVRAGAFMGYRIIADLAGLKTQVVRDGIVTIEDGRWKGYLSNVTPDEYDREFAEQIPESLTGHEFLENYGGTTDTVAAIDPERRYPVKAPTEHGIYENHRVIQFARLLARPIDDTSLQILGELMFASHSGYVSCRLNERQTDLIVEMVRQKKGEGIFGARVTGGGGGGTVALLARSGSQAAVESLAVEYESLTGRKPYIFRGSSPGCSKFGNLRLRHSGKE
ncbi:MAG TPA: galactokinase family protein [Pyrinomonadaceae bacterium]|nr:galactokinase family protein [Pyrinomonadaceae bacterium]